MARASDEEKTREQLLAELAELRRAYAERTTAEAHPERSALRENKERLRALVSVLTDIVWTSDPEGRFVTEQAAWTTYTGQSWRQSQNLGWLDAFHVEDRVQIGRPLDAQRYYEARGRLWHAPSQQYHHVILRAMPMFYPDGSVREWVGSVSDVEDGQRAERALRQSEVRHRTLVDATSAVTWSCPPSGLHVAPQPSWMAFTGQTAEEMLGAGWTRVVHPDDVHRSAERWAEGVARGEAFSLVHRIRRHDGEWRHMEVHTAPVRDANGAIVEWVGMNLDITDRIRAERTLRESEERFRGTFDNAAVGVAHVDLNGSWLRVNETVCRITGYTRDELLARTFSDITHPDDVDADWTLARRVLAGEIDDYTLEKRYIRKDGSIVPIELTVSLARDVHGQPDSFISIIVDISARKQAEANLRFQQLALDASSIVAFTDPDGTITYVNDRFCEISGYSREELIGQNHRLVNSGLHPESFFREMYATIGRGQVWRGEIRNRRKDGRPYWVDTTIVPEVDGAGRPLRYVAIRTDITERKQAEEALREREARLRISTSAARLGIFEWWLRDGRGIWENDRMYDIFGHTLAEPPPSKHTFLADYLDPRDAERFERSLHEGHDGRPWHVICRIRRKSDRALRWVEFSGTFHMGYDGRPERVVGVLADVTERTESEQALQASEERLRLAAEAAGFGTYDYDVPSDSSVWSRELRAILGQAEGQNAKLSLESIHPLDRSAFEQTLARASDPDGPGKHDIEFRIIRPDGQIRWVRDTGRTHFDGNGPLRRAVRIVGTLQDITERKLAQERLEQELARFRSIQEAFAPLPGHDVVLDQVLPETTFLAELAATPTVPAQASADRRLDAVRRLGLLDGPRERFFDQVTQFASSVLRAPISLMTVIDNTRQFFVSSHGLPEPWSSERQSPLSTSYCRHVIVSEGPVVIRDAEHNPLVSDIGGYKTGFVAYLSVPIRSREGTTVASLCVADSQPRQWTLHERLLLESMAALLMRELENRAIAAELRESEARFRTLADNMSQLAWMADETGWISWYNRRWYEYTGTTPEQMFGWGWKVVHHPEHLERVVERIQHSWDTGEPWEDTFPLRGRDGQYRWFLSRALPIRDENGKIVRWFGTNTDVTDQRNAEEALHEAGQRKDEFLATLAHELRNPLAAVSGAVHVLRRHGHVPSTRDTATGILQRQVTHLVRLIDDLMDVSRITRGKVVLENQPVALATAIADAVEAVRGLVETKAQTLEVDGGDEDVVVAGDPSRLVQVIGNLLSNANKFTPRGGTITVRLRREGDRAQVAVRDTGMGIRHEQLGRVFELFAQLDTDAARENAGLGIGLSLVKSLVELHGGSVEAHSAGLGQGAEFIVWLPVAPRAAELAPAETATGRAPSARRRVLVVDDNRDAAGMLVHLLELSGHAVCAAHDGPAAVEAAARWEPDVVLLDIGLPGLDGYEVARRIRKGGGSFRPLLVAVTGWGQEADRRRSAEAGFDFHLVKPVDVDALLGLLQHEPETFSGPDRPARATPAAER